MRGDIVTDEPYAYQIWMCSACDVEPEPHGNHQLCCPQCGSVYSDHDGTLIEEAEDA